MAGLPAASQATPKPTAVATIDPVLDLQIQTLRDQARDEATQRPRGNQVKVMMPDLRNWSGDLFAYEDMASPFDRSQSNAWFTEATKDAKKPGTTGDLALTTLQIDLLATLERSFRARHTMSRPRAMAHVTGRKFGHSHDRGPLSQGYMEFLRGIEKDSKVQKA
jgi:hypothetical protein